MPTVLIRALKASKPHFLERPLQIHKAGFHHIILLRSAWCQRLALPHLKQRYPEPRRKEGFSLVRLLLSPQSNGKKARTCFFSLHNLGILPREYFFLLRMEEEKGKLSTEDNLKKSGDVAKLQEEKSKLEKEQEKKKEPKEEEKVEVKEREMEDKIGPPPEKPLAGDCCGQGCEVCVWDIYWDELDKYKKLRKAAEEESGW